MTVARFPVRVRLDVAADQLTTSLPADEVGDGIAAALSRTITRARATDLVAAASTAPDDLSPTVSVTFRGDQLPAQMRADIERRVRTEASVAAVRLLAGRGAASAEAYGPAREPTDAERVVVLGRDADDAAYLVPGYNRRGRHVAVPLHGRRRKHVDIPAGPPTHLRLRRLTTPTELGTALLTRFRGRPPSRLVALYADAAGRPVASLVDTLPNGEGRAVPLGRVSIWLPAADTGGARRADLRIYHADELRFVGRATTENEVKAMRLDLILGYLRKVAAGRLTDKDLRDIAQERVAQISTAEQTAHVTPWPVKYFDITAGGQRLQTIEVPDILPPATIPITVLSETVTDEDEKRAPYGSDCGPLDIAEVGLWNAAFGILNPNPSGREHAFMAEPPLASLPPTYAAQFGALVKDIATRLAIQPTHFVGSFLIAALAEIDRHARTLGQLPAVDTGKSLRLTELARMAAAFTPITKLAQVYPRALIELDAAEALPCPLALQSSSWLYHFVQVFGSACDDAVASMFVASCQDVLLEVLESSRRELSRRAQNFAAYMAVTRQLLLVVLSETVELGELRDNIRSKRTKAAFHGIPLSPDLGTEAWLAATSALIDLVGDADEPSLTPKVGDVVMRDGGYYVLDRKGRWWSESELETAIAAGRQEAFALDPMLEKLADLPDVVHQLEDAQRRDNEATNAGGQTVTTAVDEEFSSLIHSLIRENEERTRHVHADRKIAFGLATFDKAGVDIGADISAHLQGIHRLADERLRPLFVDPDVYKEGVSRLAYLEISKAELIEFFNLVGVSALAVFCPAAAFLVGAVQSVLALDEAFEHRGIQRAMLGGDEIITQAQVEAEMWGAAIGAALTFLPEVPGLAKGAVGAGRSMVKGGAREAAVAAARAAMRRAAARIAELTVERFAIAFVRQVAESYIINLALSAAMERITAAVAREVQLGGQPGLADVPDIVARAIAARPTDEGGER